MIDWKMSRNDEKNNNVPQYAHIRIHIELEDEPGNTIAPDKLRHV